MSDLWTRAGMPLRDVDGDTLNVMMDSGFRRYEVARLRLARVNTPELHSSDPTVRAQANAAADYTTQWFADHLPHNTATLSWPTVPALIEPRATKLATTEVAYFLFQSATEDVFGRWLTEVACQGGHNLSDDLLADGLAVLWTR